MDPEKWELAENKVILLYTIDKANMTLSNLQITKIIMENRIMNYFILQHFLTELSENNYLKSNKETNTTFYTITGQGKKTLNYFQHIISAGIRKRIDETVYAIKKNEKNKTIIKADYMPENNNEFVVKCSVNEGEFPLIELKVAVGSKKNARTICYNWKKYSYKIYSEIIDSLINNEEDTI